MHEMSLMSNLLSQIESLAMENNAKRVSFIKVKLGALTHFSKDHFIEHFEIAAKNSIAEGADLDVELLSDKNDSNAQDILLDMIEIDDG